ncbi:nucleotidyltransferase family protein [Patulibacter sp. NPDC049589]|uniref:nucleotidyltransferase family protein n=1 Tax=Patulibacter sp. NPDC049589 TaxID=3154731 RepID=UPI0034455D2A
MTPRRDPLPTHVPRTVAVVLAAGEGRRFGGPKQLAPLHDRPLLRHALDAVLGCDAVDAVVVVLGARHEEVRAGVDLTGVRVVINDAWASGPTGSLRAGVRAARDDGAGTIVVTLGDQPLLRSADVARVLAVPADAARAVHDGRPGHPVVVRGALVTPFVDATGDDERRALLRAVAVPVEVDGGPDVDTPADLDRVRAVG